MSDSRASDRAPVHYTMKTSHPPRPSPGPKSPCGPSHSRSNSINKRGGKSPKPSTPVASPRMPYSVGQSYPPQPKLSPGVASDVRSSSPNYFGLIPEQSVDPHGSGNLPRDNWSPPTSSVKSFAAAIPKQLPIDANPSYEAFRKQADLNRGSESFALATSHFGTTPSSTTVPRRPRPPTRWHTHASDSLPESATKRPAKAQERTTSRMDVDQDSLHDSAYVSSDSKRNSEASIMQPPSFFSNQPRYESPAPTSSPFDHKGFTLPKPDEPENRHARLSSSSHKQASGPPPMNLASSTKARAETDPAGLDAGAGPSMIKPWQLKDLIESIESEDDLLLLDIRVTQQYLTARIEGALNLCTPTTLLKRPTFNLQKLQQTFQDPEDRERFSRWRSARNLVVYDSHSVEKRDAVPCLNMVKKFTNEGYEGNTFILRGGFNAFKESCPDLIDEGAATSTGGTPSLATNPEGNRQAGIPPVMGGVMLPQASEEPNPFFSNIRQNMDLADGVGQLDIARPQALDSPTLPNWLRNASKTKDHGKQVSNKFLNIEKEEQSRMKKAYSMINPNMDAPNDKNVQLCGVEKGGKNRYKDILPFEHSRVRLHGHNAANCDYINASHIKASKSNKRYITTQGPLPATYEDFWSMIWDQDIRVIVMLTAETEGGTLKCHPYWKGKDFGPVKLRLLSEKKVSLDIDKHRQNSQTSSASSTSTSASELGRRRANTMNIGGSAPTPQPTSQNESHVVIRKFAMSHGSHPFAPIREITHLYYPSWPDFGAPAQPSHLLALVELANVMQRAALPVDTPSIAATQSSPEPGHLAWYDEPEPDARARPMLVHCSAGCGRTGTFCTVDSVIDMLKRQRLAKTTLKPVRKRDSDGDIKMVGEREVEEPVTPRTAQEKAFNFSPKKPVRRSSGASDASTPPSKRTSMEIAPLDTAWVSDETVDLVAETVEDFRRQRLSMVQSLRQFVLCYETILEYIARMHERSTANMAPPTGPATGRARSGSLQVGREG